ncbi:hypothetical protein [Cellvibrio polysaccharolyticus]|uniref:Uncharacterized protein n=1 Tax=Cellvibrio polysaccharolyticus TaxID=2082724 RepID=A0A928V2C6_9GAMM|nr:hypothetical protein [Cellvibrio polysaccharolyticus]MBE8717511.1 hypothetical protein [Cellvibrio polysaccharolyticus]
MLVLGKALWKPDQSYPNVYRSFLIANQMTKKASLRQALMRNFLEISDRKLGHLDTASAFWEVIKIREKDRFQYSDFMYRIKRNCRICASKIFHSPLYDNISWLCRCPEHPHEELLETCPHCGGSWNNIVATNDCPICGTCFSFSTLIKNDALGRSESYKNIEILKEIISFAQFGIPTHDYSFPSYDEQWELSHRTHPLLPSLVSAWKSCYRQHLEIWGVTLFPCKSVTEEAVELSTIPSKPDPKLLGWASDESINLIGKNIEGFLKTRCNCQQRTPTYRKRCSGCIAYRLWRILVKKSGYFSGKFLMRYYAGRFGCRPPYKPIPYVCLSVKKGAALYSIPPQIKKLIYQFELWMTYIYFLEMIESQESFKLLGNCKVGTDREVSYCSSQRRIPIGIYRDNDGEAFTAIVPESLIGIGEMIPKEYLVSNYVRVYSNDFMTLKAP